LKPLSSVLEKLVEEVSKALGFRAGVGWSPSAKVPAATIQMRSCEITPLDINVSKHLVDMSLQVDLWDASPLARDRAADSLIQHFENERGRIAEELGLCGLRFEAVADVDDEHAFRKMLLLRLRMVG